VVSGDFNGDGDVDVAAHIGGGTLLGGSSVVFLAGDGEMGFSAGAPARVGDIVSLMAAVDVEGDGRDELLVRGQRIEGGRSVNFLELFAVDEAGGWTNRQTILADGRADSLQIVRYDDDARPDLVFMPGGGTVALMRGSDGGFGSQETLAEDVEFLEIRIFADLNNDGIPDVTAGNEIYLARPEGGFHPAQLIYIGAAGPQAAADFNRDGKMDLLSGLSVLLQK
jgi:hypothetical protein